MPSNSLLVCEQYCLGCMTHGHGRHIEARGRKGCHGGHDQCSHHGCSLHHDSSQLPRIMMAHTMPTPKLLQVVIMECPIIVTGYERGQELGIRSATILLSDSDIVPAAITTPRMSTPAHAQTHTNARTHRAARARSARNPRSISTQKRGINRSAPITAVARSACASTLLS